ncbi:putative short-chain dehydrogenase reductase family [Rosellinia necatrix]|uniref:Putative short-chain dehydrogenase reductase family n=1 Tax=Rosellinia necatrix TaxID=77044 RepID=A0A1W2TG49_ROSNE|nr:putative short-chain dehydrogenase reductase family [Rosellinia necatrix]
MTEIYSLEGRNVAITGVAGAIGTQIAIRFAKAGAKTLLLSDVSQSALDGLREALERHGPFPHTRIVEATCDVSDDAQVAGLLARLDGLGGVDVMVNNAGVFPAALDGDAVTSTARAWELTHRVNVVGTWLGCRHAVLSMRRHGKTRGSVINLSSVAGLIGSATAQLAYTASKGAVIAMTRELGIVHAREGFRFNSLCPGPLNSVMLQGFLDGEVIDGSTESGRRQRREVHLPQGRWGEPAEVAAAALFLASDASSFVNSTELVVDGGLTKAYVTPTGAPHYGSLQNFT